MNIVTSLLAALALGAAAVESAGNFQIVTYFQNVPGELQDELTNKTNVTVSFLQQFLEDCDWVEPGETHDPDGVPDLGRQLASQSSEGELGEEEEEEEDRSAHRDLGVDCPSSCSRSGSKTCTILGCAFCGRCRRKDRALNTVTAKYYGKLWLKATGYKLGLCEGACVANKDCQQGMYCFLRALGEPLPPGCTGRSVNNTDGYCVNVPPSKAPTKIPTSGPTQAPSKAPTNIPTSGPTQAPSKAPTKIPTSGPTQAPSMSPSKKPTLPPSRFPTPEITRSPTRAPTSAPQATRPPTKAPSKAPITDDADLLAEDVDEDFEVFLTNPNVTVATIEARLDRHANHYYCTMRGLTNCSISYKIMQLLANGTSYPLTGWP